MASHKASVGRRASVFTTIYNGAAVALALSVRMHLLLASKVMPLYSILTHAMALQAFQVQARKENQVDDWLAAATAAAFSRFLTVSRQAATKMLQAS